ncbi:unnamed protein product [Parnassius apollo]|uniref:(apollo) hypothetical protein n=1 Tax=Parnassius apollo TaxID=110799 RepID=A0A8S3YHC2_PARAO|nr:unnamed protein product [Parnassius apollo]
MQKLTERTDDLKQRITARGKWIRQYTERLTRFNKNRLYQGDQKRLHKSLDRSMVSEKDPVPNKADTVAFWRGLWSEPVNQRGPLDGSFSDSVCEYYAHGSRRHNAG